MKRSDIVRIRSIANQETSLLNHLQKMVTGIRKEKLDKGLEEVFLFQHMAFPGDFIIQLIWDVSIAVNSINQTTIFLKESLRDHGLVDHSIWIEQI